MSGDRTAHARRLELTDIVESADRIEGDYRRVRVTLDGKHLRFALGAEPGWVSIGLRVRELNDPNVVMTGDAFFDEHISVLAEEGNRPRIAAMFSNAGLRVATQEFFKRYPNAAIAGAQLTVPDVAAAEARVALEEGAALMLLLQTAVAQSAPVALEPPPLLKKGAPWWRSRERRENAVLIAGSTLTLFVAVGVGVPMFYFFFEARALFVSMFLLLGAYLGVFVLVNSLAFAFRQK